MESDSRMTDDGHTHVRSVNANIEGRYDIDGGKGQFAAVDKQKQIVTEYHDDNTSLKRNENASNTAAHEEVFRKTEDGSTFSSTTSSSTATSKVQQTSSKKCEAVPYSAEDIDLCRHSSTFDQSKKSAEERSHKHISNTSNFEQSLRSDESQFKSQGELISRRIEYPDENTRVVVETRTLPDGTRVTSTRREIKENAIQSSKSEQHSKQTRSEKRSSNTISTQQRSEVKESSSKSIQDTHDNSTPDIKESHKKVNYNNTRRNSEIHQEISHDDSDYNNKQQSVSNETYIHTNLEDVKQIKSNLTDKQIYVKDLKDISKEVKKTDDHIYIKNDYIVKDNVQQKHNKIIRDEKDSENIVQRKTNTDQYQTTYQTDYTLKKVSQDLSASHQAWASTLRGDTPTNTRPSTRASSPGNRTYQSSNSSLRSSISPDKTCRSPSSRGGSPSKIDRFSPSRTTTDKHSTTQLNKTETKTTKYSSPERFRSHSHSASPTRLRSSPERKPEYIKPITDRRQNHDNKSPRDSSPSKASPERKPNHYTFTTDAKSSSTREYSPAKTSPKEITEIRRPITDNRPSPVSDYPTDTNRPSPTRNFYKDTSPHKSSPETQPEYVKPSDDYPREKKPKIQPVREDNKNSTTDEYPRSTSPSNIKPDKKPTDHIATNLRSRSPSKTSSETKPELTMPTVRRKASLGDDYSRGISPYRTTPERRPGDSYPRGTSPSKTSLNKKPSSTNDHPKDISPCKSSPERDTSYNIPMLPSKSGSQKEPRDTRDSPRKASESPHRKPGYLQPTLSSNGHNQANVLHTKEPKDMHPKDVTLTRSSLSPERKSSQRKPESDMPVDIYSKSVSPSRPDTSEKRPSTRRESSESPTRTGPKKPDNKTSDRYIRTTTKHNQEDNYRFIDEETKVSTLYDRRGSDTSKPHDKFPTTTKKSPLKDTPANIPSSLRKDSPRRSPSPAKGPVTFGTDKTIITDVDTLDEIKITEKYKTNVSDSKTTYDVCIDDYQHHHSLADDMNYKKMQRVRKPSPSKYDTYDKKPKHTDEFEDKTKITKSDSLNTFDITKTKNESERYSTSPSKKTSKQSVSPVKILIKDNKQKYTTDFITIEKNTEEINKNVRAQHPRQLVTPSTSPTRKPKPAEKAPSTGQSSPTTSVSDILYFSSPKQSENHTIVTDIDDEQFYSNNETLTEVINRQHDSRPETLEIKPEPTQSKIPCRSPSPDKKSPIKDNLPRKSSLKKPSSEVSLSSVEHPPTIFQVPTTIETRNFMEHEIVKKDHPNKPDSTDTIIKRKEKPPFERRETYEERCRKILGMTEKDALMKIEKNKKSQYNDSTRSTSPRSSSISPCRSPVERSPQRDYTIVDSQEQVTDFISQERQDSARKITTQRDKSSTYDCKSNTPIRANSPTKLHDIISSSEISVSDTLVTNCDNVNEKHVSTETVARTTPSIARNTTLPLKIHSPHHSSPDKQPEERLSRTAFSNKKESKSTTVDSIDFVITEREQEILDKVQKSLRKLSPNRESKSPSREKSPGKSTTSLHDLDNIHRSETKIVDETIDNNDNAIIKHSITKGVTDHQVNSKEIINDIKTQKIPSKSTSRTTSPIKKSITPILPNKTDKSPTSESPSKARSISPRKPTGYESIRPDSPQIRKPKDHPSPTAKKPTSSIPITTKIDRNTVTDIKKTVGVTKQNSFSKSYTTKIVNNKINQASLTNRIINKTTVTDSPNKKDTDLKVTRTSSDTAIKNKKTSPQRIRSKPEIHVSEISAPRTTPKQNTSTKLVQKSTVKEPTKLTTKPSKSATSLNTKTQEEEEDIIITDVQHAKSSRENTPDHICPTPVSFLEDVGKPRLPDEVSEPDDLINRTHHTIHETETIVDDIIEISEDEELFVKRTNVDKIRESDECLLSVTDKVSKFSHPPYSKSKEHSSQFKNTEKGVHSDFNDDNLRSDECLLTVSEKVSKFTNVKEDMKTSSRTVQDEYDITSSYQDDYTKLSVNDKAHLFIDTAEHVVSPVKTKQTQKVERPDLSNVDESLRSDDCLLSVSDKVNKFIKTAEQFISDSNEVEKSTVLEEKINRRKLEDDTLKKTSKTTEEIISETENHRKISLNDTVGSFAKETVSSHAKIKDNLSPNLKGTERVPTMKITTLRSSEAVKKAKALFENIASTQKPDNLQQIKTTKLQDIGVIKKSPKTDSAIEDGSPNVIDTESEINVVSQIKTEKEVSNGICHRLQNHSSHNLHNDTQSRTSPARLNTSSPESRHRHKSPLRPIDEPTKARLDSSKRAQHESEKVPGHQRPKISQVKEDTKVEETHEISSRRGSGKFGVELKRTSLERSTISSERRRGSADHPCIEDIFDLELLEQMVSKPEFCMVFVICLITITAFYMC